MLLDLQAILADLVQRIVSLYSSCMTKAGKDRLFNEQNLVIIIKTGGPRFFPRTAQRNLEIEFKELFTI